MKKTLIKGTIFLITFVVSLVVMSKVMNKDHNNLTMEMAQASLPVISMEKSGFYYNQLHGYTQTMDTAFQRDVLTVLGENRGVSFEIDTYGQNVTGIAVEVRSADGTRLVEDTRLTDYEIVNQKIKVQTVLKDLLEKDVEYALIMKLELDNEKEIRYYTRVIWSNNLHETEKLDFVRDFHEKLYHRDLARDLTKYLETNARLENNKSFHKVNIHSSFKQITWGDLEVEEVGTPIYQLKEIGEQTASVVIHYVVSIKKEDTKENDNFCFATEYFRVRYTTDRMYLLDYERTVTQIPDEDNMYANNKILLGIMQEDIAMMESADGNVVVFEVANKLCGYNITTNKLTEIFSFYDSVLGDQRSILRDHGIKILDVDEGGNVRFAVYGYMNRGRHEGEVGVQIFAYNCALNTIEELIYIPYTKTFSVLEPQMRQLLYLNREQQLYLSLDSTVYCIDLVEKRYNTLANVAGKDTMQVSDDQSILVWLEEETNQSTSLVIRDLNTDRQSSIHSHPGEILRPLGFIGEDIIYGIARENEILEENSGRVFFPMYKICISDVNGNIIKNYMQDNIFITGCSVVDNQITLERVLRKENGGYQETIPDHIMNNEKQETGKNGIVVANIEGYETYVQLQVRGTIDPNTIQILTPKEVVFEGGRELTVEATQLQDVYYVYGPYGVEGIYSAPADAVNKAYEKSAVVVDPLGNTIWYKGNRVTRNQIMAIKEPDKVPKEESLALCLDTMLKQEGFICNTGELLAQGQSVLDILEDRMSDHEILDLTGCDLDAVLYFVNQDIPVLALLKNQDAVLLTGFNDYNVVVYEPSSGRLYKNGMKDTAKWMEENGNCFITYNRQ